MPVIAGTGSNSTHEAIELSVAAKRAGADGLLLVTPYYNRPGQEHMYRHFRAIMQAASLPTIVYNVPSRTASDLLPETIARLAEMPELVGVKEATGSALRASQVIARVGHASPCCRATTRPRSRCSRWAGAASSPWSATSRPR